MLRALYNIVFTGEKFIKMIIVVMRDRLLVGRVGACAVGRSNVVFITSDHNNLVLLSFFLK